MTADETRRNRRLIAAVSVVFALGVTLFVAVDLRPLNREEARAYLPSLALADTLTTADEGLPDLVADLAQDVGPATPPGLRLLHLPFLLVSGNAEYAYLALNLLLLPLLAVGMAGIAKRLTGVEAVPLALFFLFTMPSTIYLAARPSAAFPLLVLSVCSTHLLLASAHLSRRWPSVGFGAVLGLGMLITPIFPAYLGGPLIWALAPRARSDEEKSRQPVAVPLALGAAALVALPWYLLEWGAYSFPITWKNGENIVHVFNYIYMVFIDIFLFRINAHGALIPLAIAGIVLARREMRSRRLLLPLLWLAIPFAVVPFVSDDDPDALLPILPALALLAAAGFPLLRTRRAKAIWIAAAVVFQLAGVWNVFAGGRLWLSGLNRFQGTAASERFAPLPIDWNVRRIASAIAETNDLPAYRAVRIAVLPDFPYLNGPTLAAKTEAAGVRAVPADTDRPTPGERRAALLEADFIVQKEGYQGRDNLMRPNAREREFLRRDDQASRLRYVGSYPLPDGTLAALLYRPGVP